MSKTVLLADLISCLQVTGKTLIGFLLYAGHYATPGIYMLRSIRHKITPINALRI